MSTGNDGSVSIPAVTSSPRSLEDIGAEIAQCQEDYAQSFLKIGRLLLEAKNQLVEPGEWLKWVEGNVGYSITKVQRLMRIAKKFPDAAPVPYLDYSKAYILSRLPERDIEKILHNFHHTGRNHAIAVKDMTKRELELVVRDHLKSKIQNRKPSTAQVTQQTEISVSVENDLSDRFERIKRDVSKLASLVDNDSGAHGAFAADLCELCQSIIQQLSSGDIEEV